MISSCELEFLCLVSGRKRTGGYSWGLVIEKERKKDRKIERERKE